MSNIYNAKFMNEASATLSDKVLKRPVNETYLFSAMNILREMNSVINKNTEKLYMQIAEAESKEDENKLFANYFYEFKKIFNDFANNIEQMKSRMIMSVENKVETWEDLIKDDSYIACFDKEFSYNGYKFCHMEDSNYPRLNLYKFYQKEFDYLGTLMQDKSIQASLSARMKIIATVSNNFANSAADKGWIKCLIKEMIDIEEGDCDKSYSECIFNSLRDKEDIEVNKSVLYKCKEALLDSDDITDAAIKLCDNLLLDLNKVAENISSYLFRNNDKKLIIKTETDGVIDRDYRLDTYSMNQLDLFLKNKINQMRKLLNVYSIAIGIKFDTAVDYIDQNIDILRQAKDFNSNMEDAESVDAEDIVDDENDDLDNDGIEDTTDDHIGDDIEEDIPSDDLDKEGIEEEPETSDLGDESGEADTSFADDDLAAGLDNDSDDFEEAYLFESALFELEMLQEAYSMNEAIKAALMMEADGDNQPQTNLQKIASKQNIWQKFIEKIISLWNRFKQVFVDDKKRKIDYLKTNGKFTDDNLTVKANVTLKYNPKLDVLKNINIPDLNYNQIKNDLVDENTFIEKHFKQYMGNVKEGSLSDKIKNNILGEAQNINPTEKAHIKEAYNFCITYEERIKEIDKDMNVLRGAERAAKNLKNVTESAKDNSFSKYFTEMEVENTEQQNTSGENNTASTNTASTSNQNTDNKQNTGNSDMAARLSTYFKVCSQVLAVEMTIYQNIFNEYFEFCKWYITQAGGPAFEKGTANKEG